MSFQNRIDSIRVPLVCVLIILGSGCLRQERVVDELVSPIQEPIRQRVVVLEEPRFRWESNPEPRFELPSEEPADLSVEQAILLALKNNRDLRVKLIDPVIAGTFEWIERGTYDPEFFAEFTYGKERASETDRATGTLFDVEGTESDAVTGIRQGLPTGTEIEATVEHGRNTSDRTPRQHVARLGISVTQSLLRGYGPAANLASVRQAELDTVASLYELRGFTEALLADTEIAYWNHVQAREAIEIFERSLAVAGQQRDEVELRIEVGILPEIEAAAARTEVARREQALIDARSLLEETRLRLLRLISPDSPGGPDDALSLVIQPTSDPAMEPEPVSDLPDRLRLADRSRPDLNEARLRLSQNRLEAIVTRNGLLPQLDFFITLGRTGFANSFSKSFRTLNEDTYDVTAGVRLSQFLGNRTARAQDRANRASQRQATAAVANLAQLVRMDVLLASNEVERARQQVGATRVTRQLQEETLIAERERFDVGTGTGLLVAQAQRDLLAARISEVEAIIGYRIALVELFLAEGSLLERRGITLATD